MHIRLDHRLMHPLISGPARRDKSIRLPVRTSQPAKAHRKCAGSSHLYYSRHTAVVVAYFANADPFPQIERNCRADRRKVLSQFSYINRYQRGSPKVPVLCFSVSDALFHRHHAFCRYSDSDRSVLWIYQNVRASPARFEDLLRSRSYEQQNYVAVCEE